MFTTDELTDKLQEFIDRRVITDIGPILKSGKEATVVACPAHPSTGLTLVAAKIYRPLEERGFRDDSLYRAGRVILNGRTRRALANKSEFGKSVQFGTWIHYEWESLNHLFEVGCDVPKPLSQSADCLLMECITDDSGEPAPQLRAIRLDEQTARRVFDRMVWNITRMLARNRIHGDLSPYNILWTGREPVIIDVPQAVDPRENPHAYSLLCRDLENVQRYCAKFADMADPFKIANHLWDRFLNARLE